MKNLSMVDSYAKVLEVDLNHRQTNNKLGLPNKYTKDVFSFIKKDRVD